MMTLLGRKQALVAVLAFSMTTLIQSFRPATVSQPLQCQRASSCQTINAPFLTQRSSRSTIYAEKKDKTSLLEPGNFPTIIVEEPPQEEIYQQAIQRTLLWVGLAVAFGTGLGVVAGSETSEEFFAGYLLEQSLSVDNLFVFLILFEYFKVPLSSQDRVLNWGIYGAIVMRALMIGVGAAALQNFHAILLVFAGILVYSSAKTLIPEDEDEEEEDMNENAIVKFSRNLIDSTDEFDGSNFFTMVEGVKKATPLFICMIALEISDVVFAVDSIPAVFGVTNVSLLMLFMIFFQILFRVQYLSQLCNSTTLESPRRFFIKYVRHHGIT